MKTVKTTHNVVFSCVDPVVTDFLVFLGIFLIWYVQRVASRQKLTQMFSLHWKYSSSLSQLYFSIWTQTRRLLIIYFSCFECDLWVLTCPLGNRCQVNYYLCQGGHIFSEPQGSDVPRNRIRWSAKLDHKFPGTSCPSSTLTWELPIFCKDWHFCRVRLRYCKNIFGAFHNFFAVC